MNYQLMFTMSNRYYSVVFSNGMPCFQGESNERMLGIIIQLNEICFTHVENCNIFHNTGLTMTLSFDDSIEMSKIGSQVAEQINSFRFDSRASIELDNFDKLYVTNYLEIYRFLNIFQWCKKEYTPFILEYKKYMEFVDPILQDWTVVSAHHHNNIICGGDDMRKIITFCALAKVYNKPQLKTRLKHLLRKLNEKDSKLLNFIHDSFVNHPDVSDKFKTILRQQRILECL